MKDAIRKIVQTADGSATIALPDLAVTYHSVHGAVQESNHVFIQAGLEYWLEKNMNKAPSIFEMGFGTGLNAFLTAEYARAHELIIHYETVEAYPLDEFIWRSLDYTSGNESLRLFNELHEADWNQWQSFGNYFKLYKHNNTLEEAGFQQMFDVVYYDAFAPATQPELWTEDVFKRLYHQMNQGGILVTYCAKGAVKRALKAAGFMIESIPGPPGKREMVRAFNS